MVNKIKVTRYHDISMGHSLLNYDGPCGRLHGHNFRIYFTLALKESIQPLDMVIDFTLIKNLLCNWIETVWDHKFMISEKDPRLTALLELDSESIIMVPFNPTAENIGSYLLTVVGPRLLEKHPVNLVKVIVEETRKCSAEVGI